MQTRTSLLKILADTATILAVIVALYLLWPSLAMRTGLVRQEPQALNHLVGNQIKSLPVVIEDEVTIEELAISGQPTVLYVFASDCQVCEEQREHVGRLFQESAGFRVVTASREPHAKTARYWGKRAHGISRLAPGAGQLLGLQAVPTILVFDSAGQIRSGLVGSIRHWSSSKWLQYLRDPDTKGEMTQQPSAPAVIPFLLSHGLSKGG